MMGQFFQGYQKNLKLSSSILWTLYPPLPHTSHTYSVPVVCFYLDEYFLVLHCLSIIIQYYWFNWFHFFLKIIKKNWFAALRIPAKLIRIRAPQFCHLGFGVRLQVQNYSILNGESLRKIINKRWPVATGHPTGQWGAWMISSNCSGWGFVE